MAQYVVTDNRGYAPYRSSGVQFDVGAVINEFPVWFDCYDTPLLAATLDAGYHDLMGCRLFEVEGDAMYHDGVNGFVRQLTVLREVAVPVIPGPALARWAVTVALWSSETEAEYNQRDWEGLGAWQRWAQEWLAGTDRTALEACEPYMSEDVPDLVELSTMAAYHACTDRDVERYAAQTAWIAAWCASAAQDFDGPAFASHLDDLLQQAIADEEALAAAQQNSEVTV